MNMDQKNRECGGKFIVGGKTYTIFRGTNQIGRNKEAVVNIKSLGISQHHALFILVNDDLHFVSDLNSSNGTFLNKEKLDPFRLYRLETGSCIKFANIEGVYSKFSSQDDDQGNLTSNSDNTQNFTQTFYNNNTQIIDNTLPFKQPQVPSPDKNYISSQMLAEVADELENSITEIHESATQVINPENIRKNKYEGLSISESNSNDEANLNLQEADIHDKDESEDTNYHEAETQIIFHPHEETSVKSLVDQYELEVDNEMMVGFSESKEVNVSKMIDIENKINSNNNSVVEVPTTSNSGFNNQIVQTQESDIIKPIGLCRNILNDSSDSESDSEIIRPRKKSMNLFYSQESFTEDDTNKIDSYQNEKSENQLKEGSQDENLTFISEMPKNSNETQNNVTGPLEKSMNLFGPEETDNDEENSNDSVDFMTMQRIPATQRYSISEEDTPIKNLNSGTITNEIVENSSKNQKSEYGTPSTDSETGIEENNSRWCDGKRRKRRKRRTNETHSDSDTDMENMEVSKNESVGLIIDTTAGDLNESRDQSIINKENHANLTVSRPSIGNEEFNESDLIPATQEEHSKSTSQGSKYENSENSFKLGLTQLMQEEDDSFTNLQSDGEKEQNSKSQQSEKKFTFKKSSVGLTKSVDITLDLEQEIYAAKTQKTSDDGFLRPTQEAPKKSKNNKENSLLGEEIYILPTQKFDGKSDESSIEDIYQQSTQKYEENNHDVDGGRMNKSRHSDDELFQLPTQKLTTDEESGVLESGKADQKHFDDCDIFATQAIEVDESPSKRLESQLEHMFSTQKHVAAEDSLDKIQDIVSGESIIDGKLPCGDKDLEAILCTQKMLHSPKTSERVEIEAGKTVESQLEVIFASQTSNLPPDKFVRPSNPLVNVLDAESSNTEEIKTLNYSLDKSKTTCEKSELSSMKPKQRNQVGLEQSFALLEANSVKIRRSQRKKDVEEISVSCSKSRVSMVVVPCDEVSEKIEQKPLKTVKSSRKRQLPAALEDFVTDAKEPRRSKRKRIGEISYASDEDSSSKLRIGKLNEIREDDENVEFIDERSSRTQKKRERDNESNESCSSKKNIENQDKHETKSFRITEDKKHDESDEESEFCKRIIGNKMLRKVKEEVLNRPETPNKKNNHRKQKKKGDQECVETTINRKEDSEETFRKVSKEILADPGIEDSNDKRGANKKLETKSSKRNKTSEIDKEDESLESASNAKKIPKRTKKATEESSNRTEKKKDPVTPSRISKRECSTVTTTTPTKNRKINILDTPSRSKRKLKPKVVFTMMENPHLESQIKQLGGSIVDSVEESTVLLTKHVKRSMKLLSAVGLGKPICSEEWVQKSKKENNFLDPWNYIFIDEEAEKKWDFSLKTSLERSLETKLFEGYTFQLLATNALDVLKGAIESCGGKIVSRTPKVCKNFVVVATTDQQQKYKKIVKQQSNIIVVEPEAIFDGVLRQHIRFERYQLN